MPLWSRNEMEDCCATLATPFNEDIFNKWGGVFIDSYRDELLESQLERILQSSILRDILSNLHHDSMSERIYEHQWLLHRFPIENYTMCDIQLPSLYVEKKVVSMLDKVRFQDVVDSNSSILGKLYEQHVLNNLVAGKSLIATPYDKRTSSTNNVELKIEAIQDYTNDTVVSQLPAKNTLYVPKEKN